MKFFKKKNNKFINDSKATSFDATKHALKANKKYFLDCGWYTKKK